MKVSLINDLGVVKEIKVGWSWTFFFFTWIAFLFRGMFLPSIAIFISHIIINWHFSDSTGMLLLANLTISVTFGVLGNKSTAIYYLKKGYKRHLGDWELVNKLWNL